LLTKTQNPDGPNNTREFDRRKSLQNVDPTRKKIKNINLRLYAV